ncbi:MAG: hypothetical protein ABIL46_04750 [candidate division WOR-3 bacterium]
MKKIFMFILIISGICFAGRLGIGISGFGEYEYDYSLENYERLSQMFYLAEFHLSAEALPYMYLEPIGLLVNDALNNRMLPGVGLRINIAPRLGNFFLAPFFGIEGNILFYNRGMELKDAVYTRRLEEYFENSSPRAAGLGFGGLSIYFGKAMSLDCHYRYLYIAKGIGIEMVGAGLTYYINW